jgi:hypothetical protein
MQLGLLDLAAAHGAQRRLAQGRRSGAGVGVAGENGVAARIQQHHAACFEGHRHLAQPLAQQAQRGRVLAIEVARDQAREQRTGAHEARRPQPVVEPGFHLLGAQLRHGLDLGGLLRQALLELVAQRRPHHQQHRRQ